MNSNSEMCRIIRSNNELNPLLTKCEFLLLVRPYSNLFVLPESNVKGNTSGSCSTNKCCIFNKHKVRCTTRWALG
jgi:hypothetical protein